MAADLLIKLTLTPAIMWGVSRASRRWGGALGGLLAGLPLTSGPISIYLAVEQGAGFAARAAVTATAGVAATIVFYIVYAATGRRLAAASTFAAAFGAFLLAVLLFERLHLPLWTATAACAALLALSAIVCGPVEEKGASIAPARWDLPARMLVSTAVVLLVTGSARLIGPDLSGLLSPIPAVTWPLLVFGRHQGGVAEALAIVRGSLQGIASVLVFYIIVALALPRHDGVLAYGAALAGSVLVVAAWLVAGWIALPRSPRPTRLP